MENIITFSLVFQKNKTSLETVNSASIYTNVAIIEILDSEDMFTA